MISAENAGRLIAEVRDRTPDDHAVWWHDLTPVDQEACIDIAPRDLGTLAGIPGWALDRALRATLPAHLEELHQQRGDAGEAQRQEIADKVASLEELQQVLAEPDRQLLALSMEGVRAKAAVSVGDVDSAVHIGVYTPGMGSTVHGCLDRYDDEMARLRQRAIAQGRSPAEVATITWLGYEAPLGVVDVAQRDAAIAGSRLLQRFTDGIRSPRDDRFHLVAIGHSYGSTTTALSLIQRDHRIDDAVFFGSPGLGTSNVADLGFPPGHVYLLEAKDDAVADLGFFGNDPNFLENIVILSTGPSHVGIEVSGHANYLQEGSTSQHNIAAVVGGNPEVAVGGMVPGFGDRVRQVIEFFDRD
ncbi:MAG: alpha/beta hydrolase [Candidatus Nanopelagicales bacterium]